MRFFSIILILLCCNACRLHKPAPSVSFYYWRTTFALNNVEKLPLEQNNVNSLYIRYFDIGFSPEDNSPMPVAPIQLGNTPVSQKVIPVIYIKNEVFERSDSVTILKLCESVAGLVSKMNASIKQQPTAIQFDCDWTDKTKDKYFLFLQQYKKISGNSISATIRLHQVKYASRTGIPPVNKGVLMYYNMGEISASANNSIYQKSIADKYNQYLTTYPLPLDIALPIFSWGLQIRNKKTIHILNKMNANNFANDSNFTSTNNLYFKTKHACFKGGYYFMENDMAKIENVPEEKLAEMAEAISTIYNRPVERIILYDLDSINLAHYDKNIFKKSVDNFR